MAPVMAPMGVAMARAMIQAIRAAIRVERTPLRPTTSSIRSIPALPASVKDCDQVFVAVRNWVKVSSMAAAAVSPAGEPTSSTAWGRVAGLVARRTSSLTRVP